MYNGFVHLHNLLRWVIIILLLVVIIRQLTGMLGRKPFLPKDKRLSLILTTTVHVQFLIGLYQWIFGNFGFRLIKAAGGMGEVMKNAAMRFWVVEHITGMLIATILVTMARNFSKKPYPDQTKQTRLFWLYFVAFLLIIASVPWPFREGIARPIFPGIR
ncbi:MAG TPA: hypothetical protein VK618_07910 [Flavitalea sp.]|nr:hypothetical protein [Flavitalea sp.]